MNSYSQFGEDVLLWQHFRQKRDGFFVEVGANHPTKFSQTRLFEEQGWKGILVEPLASKCELLRLHRPASQVVQAAMGAPWQRGRAVFTIAAGDDMLSRLTASTTVTAASVQKVDVQTLDDVLAAAGNPRLDFVSIDVEGSELEVLRGFDLGRHQPAVLLVEDHLQTLAVHRFLVHQQYRLVKRTGCNNWYIPWQAEFELTTRGEKWRLWKEIHLDTPVRCVRFYFERRRSAKT